MLIELIQIALGHRDCLSFTPTADEWYKAYEESASQAIAGICFKAVRMIPSTQQPPENLYWEWLGLVSQIQQQNELMDKRTAKVWRMLKEAGLEAAVLKGQGIAAMYDVGGRKDDGDNKLSIFRQSGDIDVWVLGGYQKVCDYVQRTAPTLDLAYHRFHVDVFHDTVVELHHRPTLMRNLLDDYKLARWYNSFKAEDFVFLEDKGFAVPPISFNRIFILTHIYRHFLFEGIGLRQVMDYYFVLRTQNKGRSQTEDVRKTLKGLRLTRFAEAMMWILHTQFGMEEQCLICGMNEKEGRFVLNEILTTGNLGQADPRYHYNHFRKVREKISHGRHLLLHYPSEVLWTPVWLAYHKVWKWNMKRKISNCFSAL